MNSVEQIAASIREGQQTIDAFRVAHEAARDSYPEAGHADQVDRNHTLLLLHDFTDLRADDVDNKQIADLKADLDAAKHMLTQLIVQDPALSNVVALAEALHAHLSDIVAHQEVGAFI